MNFFARYAIWCTVASISVLCGCASNPELAKFGEATQSLADSYRPILTSPAKLCIENELLRVTSTEPNFDAQLFYGDESNLRECNNLKSQQDKRSVVIDSLTAYGMELTKLSGANPSELTPDIEGIAKAANNIKEKGGDAVFNETHINSLTTIVSTLVELGRSVQARNTAKNIMGRSQEPLNILVGEMVLWTKSTVIPRLQTSIDRRKSLLNGLAQVSSVPEGQSPLSAYAIRVAQLNSKKEIDQLSLQLKSAEEFIPAANQFLATHKDLYESFESGSKSAKVKAVQDFIGKLKAIRESAKNL